MRLRAALLLLLVGCPKAPAVPTPEALPADVPIPREGGPAAGPRYVVDAPPPPQVAADVPGQGAIGPYMSLLRRDLADRMSACTSAPSGGGAMLRLVLAYDGAPTTVTLVRSSGDAAWDACLLASVGQGAFEVPPPELLEGTSFATDLVFR